MLERVVAGEPLLAVSVTLYSPSGEAAGTATVTFIVFVLPGVTCIVLAPGVACPPGSVVEAVSGQEIVDSVKQGDTLKSVTIEER